MSFVAGNITMDLFYLLKENFKNLLFDLLIARRSFKNFPYLSICSLPQRERFARIRLKVLQGIESDLAYTEVLGLSPNTFYGLEAYGNHQAVPCLRIPYSH